MNAKKVAPMISTESDDAVVFCLTEYWISQGLTLEQATTAAYNALERLKENTCDETWCLLAEQE